MTEAEVLAAVKTKFSAGEWAVFTHVRERTGYSDRGLRTADAVAVGVWPSTGQEVLGFEVKTSRADWLRELRDPAKAEGVYRYCDRWWLVTPEKCVSAGELPEGWGHMVVVPRGLRVVVPAQELKPLPVTRGFLASLCRKAIEHIPDEVAARVAAAEAQAVARNDAEIERLRGTVERLETAIAEFEAASGIEHLIWGSGSIGRAVRFVRTLQGDDRWHSLVGQFDNLASQADRIAASAREQAAAAADIAAMESVEAPA